MCVCVHVCVCVMVRVEGGREGWGYLDMGMTLGRTGAMFWTMKANLSLLTPTASITWRDRGRLNRRPHHNKRGNVLSSGWSPQ